MKQFLLTLSAFLLCLTAHADVVWFDGTHPITYSLDRHADPVVITALSMFCEDMRQVTGTTPVAARKGTIVIRQGKGRDDGFSITTAGGRIIIEGHNARGTAYGLLELSRMAGVSPWVWWGDVVPERRGRLALADGFHMEHTPSVEFRGIFINDEDWSTRPWSYLTHDAAKPGTIGAQTYKRIFQLLLRLRANAIWPAMHEGTTAFFRTPGAKAMADSCGIVVGTSHCEPLLRNNVGEWDKAQRGAFNYRSNRQAVHDYWTERLREVRQSTGNMFTIGMRGIHDSSMEGYKTDEEKYDALQQVIDDQQQLIAKHIGDPSKQMQVFVPYKEVLSLYERGLRVPDYVTLLWCDDNYGYMTRFSDAREQQRSGGAGVYYHLSYWGRPHDHLWLATTQPGLICHEMHEAYDYHMRKLWIANVHDPKVAGYQLELFLDLAWDIDCASGQELDKHLGAWLCRQFGTQAGTRLLPVMEKFYRLCGERKPEFMGWSQVELDKRLYDRGVSPTRDSEFSLTAFGGELDRYLMRYERIAEEVKDIASLIRPELSDAYFAAVRYPVEAACAHAVKLLEAQRARQLAGSGPTPDSDSRYVALRTAVARSQTAYQQVRRLTDHYNNVMSGGKWRHSMCDHPRNLPVFWAPALPFALSDDEAVRQLQTAAPRTPHPTDNGGAIARNACDYDLSTGAAQRIRLLGHSMNAVALAKEASLTYHFDIASEGDYTLYTALIPTQPCDGGDLRYSVSIDEGEPTIFSLKEPFRSETWKINVLRGQARRQLTTHLTGGRHTLTLRALDDHIIVDQWMADPVPGRAFYLFPVE